MEMIYNQFINVNAGQFLQECLQCSGFSIGWLAEKTNSDVAALEMLFRQDNMDAELFVSIGRYMGNAFWEPLHAVLFHDDKVEKETAREAPPQ